jgi:hypothetical protein
MDIYALAWKFNLAAQARESLGLPDADKTEPDDGARLGAADEVAEASARTN